MTDKEFRKLNRAQLIEIIYQLQLKVDELTEQNQSLEDALADKRLRISQAGNLAEAALDINNCFRSAQDAAEQYLSEIKIMHAEIEAQRNKICSGDITESPIVEPENSVQENPDSIIEAILKEYGLDLSEKGR